ncbi:hypothetical protein ACO0K7_16145 [Undibacterium sp. Ji67W]|uniref:hypothetical protein n=1 Tax=Undibacterium sp. Ji67W TaxID=3413042 RepID=UPI003BEF78AB
MQESLFQAVISRFAYHWQRIWDTVYSPSQGEFAAMSDLELNDLGIGRGEIPRFQEPGCQPGNHADIDLLRQNTLLIIPDDPATNK